MQDFQFLSILETRGTKLQKFQINQTLLLSSLHFHLIPCACVCVACVCGGWPNQGKKEREKVRFERAGSIESSRIRVLNEAS